MVPSVGVKIRCWPQLLLAVVLVGGCANSGSGQTSIPSLPTSASVTTAQEESTTSTVVVTDWIRYTEDALSVFQENYLWSDEIDWKSIREVALGEVEVRPTRGSAHQALVAALGSLDDIHTYFVYPVAVRPVEPPGDYQDPAGLRLDGDIGYLSVPGFVGDQAMSTSYATNLHEAMWAASEPDVCGWVVDLRLNVGGYLPPMILGIGPLLGEGVVVTYRAIQESSIPKSEDIWNATYEYRPPHLFMEGVMASERWGTVETEPFPPIAPSVPIAVLISNVTRSAGEGALVAFLGRPSTRVLGTATYGVATGPTKFLLPDGAALVITTSVAQDRMGRVYETEIAPDERIVDLLPDDENDDVLTAASAWLSGLEPCED